jgi:hypothetical protein
MTRWSIRPWPVDLMLAPVRNDRKSAGKTTAVSADLAVSRHAGAVVGARLAAMMLQEEETRVYKVSTLPHRRQEQELWKVVPAWYPA